MSNNNKREKMIKKVIAVSLAVLMASAVILVVRGKRCYTVVLCESAEDVYKTLYDEHKVVVSSKKVVQFFVSDFYKRFEEAGGHIFVSKSCKYNPNTMVYINDLNDFYHDYESVVNDILKKIRDKK